MIFQRIMAEPDGANLLFMLEENGQPIGFMNTVVFYSVWAHGKVLFLDDFFIREPFRGKRLWGSCSCRVGEADTA